MPTSSKKPTGAAVRKVVWVPLTPLQNALGISHDNAISRGVAWKEKKGKQPRTYDLYQVLTNCSDLIVDHLDRQPEDDAEDSAITARHHKVLEEVRKLRLLNDERERLLVPAEEVAPVFERGMHEISNLMDTMLPTVKMRLPDVGPHTMDVISSVIIETRNKIANIEINWDDD